MTSGRGPRFCRGCGFTRGQTLKGAWAPLIPPHDTACESKVKTTTTTTQAFGPRVTTAVCCPSVCAREPKRVAMSAARDVGSSAARRRRERRLRSFLRHERLAVAMAVAEARHHSSRGQTTATAISEVEEQETNNAPRRQKARPPGMRPASLAEPQGTQVVLQRHVAEQVLYAPVVHILDAPMPQTGDQLIVAFRSLDNLMADQVIAVPKISCPSHAGRAALREPQIVEQLVEVPTVLTYSFIQQRTAEHIIDLPVPRTRGLHGGLQVSPPSQVTQRTAEQITDFPVRRTGTGGGLQGSSSGQGSAQRTVEQNVDITVPRTRAGGLHGFFPGTCSSQRSEVQNADIPVPRALDFLGNPRGFHHSQSSSAFRGADRHDVFGSHHHDYGLEDEEGTWRMRTWSRWRSSTSLWTASSTPAGDPCASATHTTVVGAPGGGSARSLMANKNSTPERCLD